MSLDFPAGFSSARSSHVIRMWSYRPDGMRLSYTRSWVSWFNRSPILGPGTFGIREIFHACSLFHKNKRYTLVFFGWRQAQ
ncbi:hypothetical protein GcM1_203013 [Golovinomyces cichoracearum]|uniref:Uncharacterized protein n=1 Tax=Golovinomyces cichoracearum TaxID=62708 RepID=A0A420IXS7_9PEZI|nr:hypothetical protein GcM1_203013 [Golovinomyces cichoracearum]